MRQVELPGEGERLPVMGQGTWGLGASRERFRQEVEALQLGLELGMTLIDTAEFYAAGGAERVVAAAIRGVRQRCFIISKVWPSHADAGGVLNAIQGSLRRLETEYLDAVLIHWPTRSVPLSETWRGFQEAKARGWVRHLGVSNFAGPWLTGLERVAREEPARFNEVPYRLSYRVMEGEVSQAEKGSRLVLAYSPLGHGHMGRVLGHPAVQAAARRYGVTAHQIALAWVVQRPGVIALPKAVQAGHVRDNAAAGALVLDAESLGRLDAAFPVARAPLRILPPYGWFFRVVEWGVRRRSAGNVQ